MTARELIELWRDSIGDLPGIHRISFEAERGPGRGRDDVSIALSHSDEEVLEQAAAALVSEALQFSNTRDVSESYDMGKTQLDFELLPEARVLGLTAADVGNQLRGAFHGSLALRLMRGTNEIEVRVKLPEEERKDIHNLQDLVIRTPQGSEVPLFDVVTITENEAFSRINRRNGRRIVSVSMDIEPKRAAGQVLAALDAEVLPELRQNFPGLTWTFEGRDAAMRESMVSLVGGFGIALFGIYALLAIALKSYLQPVVVLGAVPFGIIGAVFGHMLLGYDLSLVSVMGIVALSGIVVNDSLIMIDYANRHRADSTALEAILLAGVRRFRPIFLTTATTFCGLTPLILEKSLQAQYIIPMAISLGFGIVFATVVVLILVPCLYLILEDFAGSTVLEVSHEPA